MSNKMAHNGIYERTSAASTICACGVVVPQHICNGIESDLVDTQRMLNGEQMAAATMNGVLLSLGLEKNDHGQWYNKRAEDLLAIVGPPDGAVDMIALVAEIATPELLRQALVKVREQIDEYKRQADGYHNEVAKALDGLKALERKLSGS